MTAGYHHRPSAWSMRRNYNPLAPCVCWFVHAHPALTALVLGARHLGCPAAQTAEDHAGEQEYPAHDSCVGPVQGVRNGKNAEDGCEQQDAYPKSIQMPHWAASLHAATVQWIQCNHWHRASVVRPNGSARICREQPTVDSARGGARHRRDESVPVTFRPQLVPGGDVAAFGARCRTEAVAGLQAQDWRPVHDWSKSWIGSGGGAWLPGPWLLYAASALLKGEPRIAVHSLDLALRVWLAGRADRAALTWLRGVLVVDQLKNPKAALVDLRESRSQLPDWLTTGADDRLAACEAATATSRMRVPSVKPRPEYSPLAATHDGVAPPVSERVDGQRPSVWDQVGPLLTSPP